MLCLVLDVFFLIDQTIHKLEGCIDDERQFKTAKHQTHLLHPDPDPNPNPDPTLTSTRQPEPRP